MVDGLLIVIGGTLLLTPGFLTDIFGLFLLIPPTRAIVRRVLRRLTIGRFTVMGMPGSAGPFGPGGPSRPEPPLRLRRHRRGGAAGRRRAAAAAELS